ncbi:LysR substrate-binding domain-containing protein [Azohydromonas lata]|uniref:LysR substrate-binding domain-containing protein n=1 Tax=Azohydromonas lata TaxID=45677 RepID=UPI000834F34C|nr:LysR substrate-binding domain-containing protein [Azohydromonas lata]
MRMPTQPAKGYRRLFPSLMALVQFEAVARLQSFTEAAAELGVTQAAVSKQIKLLEESVGAALFVRQYRSIALTHEGKALSVAMSGALQGIASVYDELAQGHFEQEIILASTAALTHFRLLPNLATLRAMNSSIKLRLTTQMFNADLRRNEFDVAVRWGHGQWQDGTSIFLFKDEAFPVCSPAWLAVHPQPITTENLASQPLIDYDATSEDWMNWDKWFKHLGFHRPRLNCSLRCTLFNDAVQAALHGQGITLGWRALIQDDLAAGRLVRITQATVQPSESYYAVIAPGNENRPVVQTLLQWIRQGLD